MISEIFRTLIQILDQIVLVLFNWRQVLTFFKVTDDIWFWIDIDKKFVFLDESFLR